MFVLATFTKMTGVHVHVCMRQESTTNVVKPFGVFDVSLCAQD